MATSNDAAASVIEQRVRNYLQVVNERIGHGAEELTREVNFLAFHEVEWQLALKNVDNPLIGPAKRAAMFHRLIEQGTGDALHGDAGEWQVTSGDDRRAREANALTAPERIARVVQRIRTDFPRIADEIR